MNPRTYAWRSGALLVALAAGLSSRPTAQCVCLQKVPGESKWIDFEEMDVFDDCVPMVQPPPFHNDYTSIEKEMAVFDFDQDGDLDVMVVQKFVHDGYGYTPPMETENLFLRFENGVFTCANDMVDGFDIAKAARDLALLDFNNDGLMDFAVTHTGGLSLGAQPRLFRNDGFGATGWKGFKEETNAFSQLAGIPDPWWSCSISAGDVDCDGYDDLVIGDYGPGFSGASFGDRLFLNRWATQSQFVEGTTTQYFVPDYWHTQIQGPATLHNNTGIQLADLDGDGAVDIFRSIGGIGGEVVWNSKPCPQSGPFFDQVDNALAGGSPYMIMAADIDGDGLWDGYSGGDQCDRVTINNGDPNPNNWDTYQVSEARISGLAGNVVSVDLDNDGLLDWVVADIDQTADICGPSNGLALLRTIRDAQGDPVGAEDPNDLDGNCGPCVQPGWSCRRVIDEDWNTESVYDVVFFDIDQDGYQDMLQGTCDGFKFFRMKPFFEKDPNCDCAGAAAELSIDGNPSVAQNALVLTASGLPANKNARFFYSFDKLPQGVPSFDGTLCIGPNLARLDPTSSDGNGDVRYELDLTTGPPSGGGSQIDPGDTVYFQLQYRDPAGPNGITYSDVIEVTFWE